jgi:hypothetical protein
MMAVVTHHASGAHARANHGAATARFAVLAGKGAVARGSGIAVETITGGEARGAEADKKAERRSGAKKYLVHWSTFRGQYLEDRRAAGRKP